MTIEDAVAKLKSYCKSADGKMPKSFGGFYCGITNNVTRRESEHGADYLGWVKAKNINLAKQLECRMHEEGFDTGDQLGNGQPDSLYVYVYKKDKDTVE